MSEAGLAAGREESSGIRDGCLGPAATPHGSSVKQASDEDAVPVVPQLRRARPGVSPGPLGGLHCSLELAKSLASCPFVPPAFRPRPPCSGSPLPAPTAACVYIQRVRSLQAAEVAAGRPGTVTTGSRGGHSRPGTVTAGRASLLPAPGPRACPPAPSCGHRPAGRLQVCFIGREESSKPLSLGFLMWPSGITLGVLVHDWGLLSLPRSHVISTDQCRPAGGEAQAGQCSWACPCV